MWNMRVVALLVVCGLMAGQDGGSVGAAQRTRATGSVLSALRRRTAGELAAEDPGPCFSLRGNEDQRQLLCTDRRSKFNFNPFGLRFGRRVAAPRPALRAGPRSLFSRELEVPA